MGAKIVIVILHIFLKIILVILLIVPMRVDTHFRSRNTKWVPVKQNHSDNLFIVSDFQDMQMLNNEFSADELMAYFSRTFQIAIIKNSTRLKKIQTDEIFHQSTFHIFSELNHAFGDARHLVTKTSGTSWLFYNEKSIPKNFTFSLTGNVLVADANFTWNKIYEIKGVRYREVITRKNYGSRMVETTTLRERKNLHGATLTIAHVIPNLNTTDSGRPLIITSSGQQSLSYEDWGSDDRISYQFLAFMQDYLNFSVEFHEASSWVWAPSNTTYSMADLLSKQQLDLAISNTGLWASRVPYRFLFVTRVFREIYVYYHPPDTFDSKDMTKSIGTEVWMCFVGYAIIIFLISMLIFQEKSRTMFLWSIATMTEQGVPVPRSRFTLTANYFILACSISGLLFYASLSAILVSTFSIQFDINNLQDLISRKYVFGIEENSILHNGFKDGFFSNASTLWGIRSSYKIFHSEIIGAAEIVNLKNFAFISLRPLFLNYPKELAQLNVCGNLKEITLQGEKRWGSAFVKPNSEFSEHFNLARIVMSEAGITDREVKRTGRISRAARPNCIANDLRPNQKGISLKDTRFAFLIFIFGLLISVIVLVMEATECRKSRLASIVTRARTYSRSLSLMSLTGSQRSVETPTSQETVT